jgi:hypothetical protein
VSSKNSLTLHGPEGRNDAHGLLDVERDQPTRPSQGPEAPPFDAQLPADLFDLDAPRPDIPGDGVGVDARRSVLPIIHNAFFVPGKVPSLNDLLEARGAIAPVVRSLIMRRKPGKAKSRGARFDLYNDIKQDWKRRTMEALGTPSICVRSAFFAYLIVEETLKRDPSNICSAAVKFIEDGLVEAGIIPNDGWDNVLGIRVHWVHRKGRIPGVFVLMSDAPLSEQRLLTEYEEHFPRLV